MKPMKITQFIYRPWIYLRVERLCLRPLKD